MPKTHLRKPRFTYSASTPVAKRKKEFNNLKNRRIKVY